MGTRFINSYNPEVVARYIADKIIASCKNKGISYYALAKKTNISTSTIYSILEGKTIPRLLTLLDLCHVLEISVVDMLYEIINGKDRDRDLLEISEEEKQLLLLYRNLSKEKRICFDIYVKMLQQYDENS